MSTLERGLKNVTVEKAADLARYTGVHPLTLMVETFLILEPDNDLATLIKRILKEVEP